MSIDSLVDNNERLLSPNVWLLNVNTKANIFASNVETVN